MTFKQRGRRNVALGNSAVSRNTAPQALRDLRRPRHAGLFEAVHRLDAQLDRASREELASWIRDQYSVEYGDIPVGFVAICHLGPPYVDHRLDLVHSIVEHYGPGDSMPEPFAQARMLARTGAYEFVEVYASGQLVPVRADGSVVGS
ncbi:MAG: hypothetical protein ACRDT0_16450 [Pseudonocardiaceae bacterium]